LRNDLRLEQILYNKFKDEVIDKLEKDEAVTRAQIMYQLGITDMMVDKLLCYIKRNLSKDTFNHNTVLPSEGFRVEFMKPKKITKMFIIKL